MNRHLLIVVLACTHLVAEDSLIQLSPRYRTKFKNVRYEYKRKGSLLQCAIMLNLPLEEIKLVYEQNPDSLHVLNQHEVGALHTAARENRADVVELLLQYGAKINHQDRWHNTPAHYAAIFGGIDALRILAQYNANFDIISFTGHTPLSWSILTDNVNAATILIDAGARTDYAVQVDLDLDIYKKLGESLPATLTTSGGYTLKQLAKLHNNPDVLELITNAESAHAKKYLHAR